ncbi:MULTISPECIES: carbohydrate kinase family protein [unclassified Ruminococcus]|uniref:carbohydrate kinase family protein n=1 Tax=unclassified Ruminococcus TaxID=2608920 RepID=UPI00210E128C|nr:MULTISPECIES: carbohydrate kinase family protein [unclassified Ruminococcus]MCQ4022119.1 carbohydrate kinase family protein [Ruminococcus sp. zg-924]MCQ4114439.1 carbohydrate kinase family protein [Ruminococcus sp. zg-921]
MSKILVSGLINTETTLKINEFPIPYYPIDYPFFGVNTRVSGVGYNLTKALTVLSDEVKLCSVTGNDFAAEYIISQLNELGVSDNYVKKGLSQTPSSVVLYDSSGKRQIHCDLKDIQDSQYGFTKEIFEECDLIIACNINFNRELLKLAKEANKEIATDVHVLSDIEDSYNSDFMKYADILFLSDENIGADYRAFLTAIEQRYHNEIIVLGRGSKGACMYVKKEDRFYDLPAIKTGEVVNTVGAGDALFSGFIHYHTKGYTPVEALLRAEIVASLKIGHNGASEGFPKEAEVEAVYNTISKSEL